MSGDMIALAREHAETGDLEILPIETDFLKVLSVAAVVQISFAEV
jgi:hypothetical protein